MFDTGSALSLGFTFVITFGATFAATPLVAKAMRSRGITGVDIHKLSKTEVPEMCGLAVIIGLAIGVVGYCLTSPLVVREAAAFIGTILIAGAIGIIDDLHPLGARVKPLLTAVACIPILVLGTYVPYPDIPLVGPVRLTIVYPIMIPIAIAVTSNSINMMDVMNGSMPGTVAIIALTMVGILLWSGEVRTATLAGCLLAAMLAFFYFNRFPSKVFGGDTGSLSVGAALGALAILGRIEAVTVVALIPHIMNSFYGLSSVRGLRERREITQRPTMLLDNGLLQASDQKAAPVTLARLILAAGPLGERAVVRGMILLTAVSSLLAVLTYWITVVVK
jgi:UDP-N-acetylmuramyl pentapeptide phosphotransferase/UDP-N-acetylglucosamine-1-phosphate transferase